MGAAADRYAAITRDQWNNYKLYGIPKENELIGMIDNKATLNQNLANATNTVQTAGNVAGLETARSLSQYGVTPSADQTRTNNRLNSLNTTASMADARNFVRQEHLDQGQTILNGAPNSGLDVVSGG